MVRPSRERRLIFNGAFFLSRFASGRCREAEKECGKDTSTVVNQVVRSIQSALSNKCEAYTYYSPICIYTIW